MFDAIFFINLAESTDRLAQVSEELRTHDLLHIATRVDAIRVAHRGAEGCLLSHIKALRMGLDAGHDHFLVVEDDITFVRDPKSAVAAFLADHPTSDDWDLVMLAFGFETTTPHKPGVDRVHFAHGAAAYAVTRRFAKTLLAFWEGTTDRFNAGALRPQCDASWTELIPTAKWFCLQPRVGLQRPGFSIICGCYQNYGV